jgi:predicted DCC family thiol-disulfide oxidoreductase YuxK
VLVYDGDCAFCTRCVQWIERHLATRAELVAWQFADLAALGVPQARAEHEVVWIGADGRVDGGAQAVAALLIDSGGPWRILGTAMRSVPVRALAHLVYRLVADNRHRLPGGTPACVLPPDQRPGAGRQAP